jgi:DNA (cytosine-5)-methyltransferase 1
MTLTAISMCSGIESASVASRLLGWHFVAFSEIEAFPSAVLAHHYPDVPNLGDMTKVDWRRYRGLVDVVVAGTPCQAFSVAGARQGLSDDRGNLALVFTQAVNDIDPRIVVWENVPGVLSSKDNAFGHFLAGLAGEDVPFFPSGKTWTKSGYVLGPKRTVAWRILDAQYFGLAQRRQRVFVVACPHDFADPREILFEFEGVRRDAAPSREPGQETAGTLASRTGAGGFPGTDEGCSGYLQPVANTLPANSGRLQLEQTYIPLAFGGGNTSGPIDVSTAMLASGGWHGDFDSETFALSVAFRGRDGGNMAELGDDVSTTLRTGDGGSDKPHVLAFKPSHYTRGKDGAPSEIHPPLTADADKGDQDPVVLAFSCKDYGNDVTSDMAPTMRAMNSANGTPNGGGQLAVAYAVRTNQTGANGHGIAEEASHTIDTTNGQAVAYPLLEVGARTGVSSTDPRAGIGIGDQDDPMFTLQAGKQHGVAWAQNSRDELREMPYVGALAAEQGSKQTSYIRQHMAVRRLMPVECERLQGFPDGYTDIVYRGKPAADGPRYKALGNSKAVNVVRWLFNRIDQAATRFAMSLKEVE